MDGGAAAIEVLLQNLIDVLKEDYFLLQGLDDDVQQLQTTLGIIQAYLNDAANKSITPDVKIWLRELEDVAFKTDNVLDELSYHLLHKKVKKMKTPTAKDKMLSCFSACSDMSRRLTMARTIKHINTTFESMNTKATGLGLQSKILSAPVAAHTSIETNSVMHDPIFVGRDDEVSEVADKLTRIPQDQTISIVALVGMGGMGKTTLTRRVFNHERLKKFGSNIWVHVSQTFDPIGLYNKIHSILASTTGDRVERVEHEETILNKLREVLRSKTYLLVLDDVWNEDILKWEGFINNMKGVSSTKGNGIIITTRRENVASIADPFHIHRVNRLSDQQCWSIIKARSFDGNVEVPLGFQMIGKEIAKRCQGLPLAANVVGGVLRRCKSEQEWCAIKDPEWIGELHHLQTLRADLWRLEKLPSTLKYLINLRHLYLGWETKLPAEIGKLASLQTLEHFKVGEEKGYQIEELGSLKNLKGSLWIQNLERVRDKEEAMKAYLLQKSNLSNLRLEWNEDSGTDGNYESVLEGLQPHANLKVLGIDGFKGITFPAWCKKMAVRNGSQGSWVPLDNLIEISLCNCSECEEIPMLDHSLPNLKSLYLINLKKVRSINIPCKNLKSLVMFGLQSLQYLPESLFCNNPSLSNLEIVKCPVLSELPDGLDTLNSLEELTIRDCPNLKLIKNPSGGPKNNQGILHELRIIKCEKLMALPCQILESSAPTIKTLVLEELRSLKNLPMLIDCLAKSSPRLEELTIRGVPNFMASGFIGSWSLGRLKVLCIDVSVEWSMESSVGIRETVEGMLQGCANSLEILYLKWVENWEWMPQSIQHLTALSNLMLENIGVQELTQSIQHLTALSSLGLMNIGVQELPQSIQNLTSLSLLKLENIGIQELPEWLRNLSSMQCLILVGCKKLRCLPSVDALKRLSLLEIEDCPELCIDSEWRNNPNLYIRVDGVHLS
ncbi:putative disease resistance protein RGA3 [Salvia hispanica]|uniref:putative disease resistance protein RGA3 n=1 Tax=Salvia hispanica TaxID=49212 RepID=UPI0020099844|nr:putative disease resistance protein RGA3 [Salvia hispanica]